MKLTRLLCALLCKLFACGAVCLPSLLMLKAGKAVAHRNISSNTSHAFTHKRTAGVSLFQRQNPRFQWNIAAR
jgi:hypothetical protein